MIVPGQGSEIALSQDAVDTQQALGRCESLDRQPRREEDESLGHGAEVCPRELKPIRLAWPKRVILKNDIDLRSRQLLFRRPGFLVSQVVDAPRGDRRSSCAPKAHLESFEVARNDVPVSFLPEAKSQLDWEQLVVGCDLLRPVVDDEDLEWHRPVALSLAYIHNPIKTE